LARVVSGRTNGLLSGELDRVVKRGAAGTRPSSAFADLQRELLVGREQAGVGLIAGRQTAAQHTGDGFAVGKENIRLPVVEAKPGGCPHFLDRAGSVLDV